MRNLRIVEKALACIVSRELPQGGFDYSDTGYFSPEASAWAVLALKSSGRHLDAAERAASKLSTLQLADGRVSAVEGAVEAIWCTPICILAWKCLSGYERSIAAGVEFLLNVKGLHPPKASDSHIGHDPSIIGWPWIEHTHSWVPPTSLAIIALKATGYLEHQRTQEGALMLMNRQLPSGGWNYGNTTVYGKELLPTPDNTGLALYALAGIANEDTIRKSVNYLIESIPKTRTPLSLAWLLQGLAAWSKLPKEWENLIIESLELQSRYGPYDTALLAMLVFVYFTRGNFTEILG